MVALEVMAAAKVSSVLQGELEALLLLGVQ